MHESTRESDACRERPLPGRRRSAAAYNRDMAEQTVIIYGKEG